MGHIQKFFGTDGIRGRVGDHPITADCMLKIGWAIGSIIADRKNKKILIGKDTRVSGYMIESALQAGLSAAGANVYLLGPMPTSGIAYLTQTLSAELGIVISASHNPYDDNGIKLFTGEGFRLSAALEKEIENKLEQTITTVDSQLLGKAKRIDDAAGRYIEYCKSAIPRYTHFENYKLIVDCANGATYHIAPHVFSELGADVTAINVSPNGFNINKECGSNHPEVIRSRVLEAQADVGIAFDGDGDRVILIDHRGEILDGDEILYIIVKGLIESGNYSGGIVSTEMSNQGLELAMKELGLAFERVEVGGQHVINALKYNHWTLGGEPSGHITYLRTNTTDDGIIAALLVLQTMHQSGKSLHDLKHGIKKFPQRVVNIAHNGTPVDLQQNDIINLVKEAELKLGKNGRLLLRNSGTQPLVRIMMEGEDQMIVDDMITKLEGLIKTKV